MDWVFVGLSISELLKSLASLAAIAGIWIAVLSYWRQTKIKKAEWLYSLFEKFYESQHYKEVRRWLDFDMLEQELVSDNDPDNNKEEKLSDFLNFFEFIATLERERQLSLSEIRQLFDYYLKRISNSQTCMEYIRSYAFTNLSNLLKKVPGNEKD